MFPLSVGSTFGSLGLITACFALVAVSAVERVTFTVQESGGFVGLACRTG